MIFGGLVQHNNRPICNQGQMFLLNVYMFIENIFPAFAFGTEQTIALTQDL